MAKDICQQTHIDILHQLNMIGFREPGYLWEIPDIPFIWGPVDAKESFPMAYLEGASLKTKLFIQLKNTITKWQLQHAKRVRLATERALFIISASSNSQHTFKKYFQIESPLLNETGCYIQEHPIIDKSKKEYLDVLWVGKLDFRKQLGLALRSVTKTQNPYIKLHIVGGGNNLPYQALAKNLGIETQCKWYGTVSHEEVQKIMQESDVFFFTSVAEGTPHVVLEAIGNNLPVVCFDTCGQGDSVNEKVGIKISLSTPNQSIIDFAEKINYLYQNRSILQQLSEGCNKRQKELSWGNKTLQMIELYNKALN